MVLHKLDRYRDIGLLLLRIGIGIMFIGHGYPKLMGGQEKWIQIGGALTSLGINLNSTLTSIMGFMAALSETGGGLFLIFGLFTRPACLALLGTMIVATLMHIKSGHPFQKYSHALEAGILFFSLLLIGPGKWSFDAVWSRRCSKRMKASTDN